MCTTATAVKDAVEIETVWERDGIGCIEVALDSADPYASFKKLPSAVEYNGRVYGKSGYDSDVNRAYFRTDKPIAHAI